MGSVKIGHHMELDDFSNIYIVIIIADLLFSMY